MNVSPPPPRRLNPFAFPLETDMRFIMLIVAAIAIAVNMSIYYTTNLNTPDPLESIRFPSVDIPPEQYLREYQTVMLIMLSRGSVELGLLALFVIATFTLALLIYRTHPNRVRRTNRLSVFQKEKDTPFPTEVERLAGVAGIALPSIEVGNNLRDQSGQAFGFPNRYSLRLDGGLRLLLRKAPESFRAIVLHEMAHIANDDIQRTYFTHALWYGVIFITLLPTLLTVSFSLLRAAILKPLMQGLTISTLVSLYTVNLPTGLWLFIRIFSVVAIVWLIRAGLLRAREIYADWHAALWGVATPLVARLKSNLT